MSFAYACDPHLGSEPAVGWALTRALSSFAEVVALHGPEHTESIRKWTVQHHDSRVTYLEVGEPAWCERANRFRIGRFLSYMAWLRRAYVRAREIHRDAPFDVAHHATFSTYWLPSPVWKLGIPVVWGPIGGAVVTPLPLWPLLGWRGVGIEILDAVAVRTAELLPQTRDTWRWADVPLVMNPESLGRLPSLVRKRSLLLNHVEFLTLLPAAKEALRGQRVDERRVVYASPLVPRKGPLLALRAFARLDPAVRLSIVGDGPERPRVEREAARLGVEDRVTFHGWVSREELWSIYARAAVALFTGLREEGGASLSEAMALGTPVVVLDVGGAGMVARRAKPRARVRWVPPGSVEDTAVRLAAAIEGLLLRKPGPRTNLLDDVRAKERLEAAFRRALNRRNLGQRDDRAATP